MWSEHWTVWAPSLPSLVPPCCAALHAVCTRLGRQQAPAQAATRQQRAALLNPNPRTAATQPRWRHINSQPGQIRSCTHAALRREALRRKHSTRAELLSTHATSRANTAKHKHTHRHMCRSSAPACVHAACDCCLLRAALGHKLPRTLGSRPNQPWLAEPANLAHTTPTHTQSLL